MAIKQVWVHSITRKHNFALYDLPLTSVDNFYILNVDKIANFRPPNHIFAMVRMNFELPLEQYDRKILCYLLFIHFASKMKSKTYFFLIG